MIQLTEEETTVLREQWIKCSDFRKAFGEKSYEFKEEFEIYQNMMRELGRKYGYDEEYAKVYFDGVVTIGKRPYV